MADSNESGVEKNKSKRIVGNIESITVVIMISFYLWSLIMTMVLFPIKDNSKIDYDLFYWFPMIFAVGSGLVIRDAEPVNWEYQEAEKKRNQMLLLTFVVIASCFTAVAYYTGSNSAIFSFTLLLVVSYV